MCQSKKCTQKWCESFHLVISCSLSCHQQPEINLVDMKMLIQLHCIQPHFKSLVDGFESTNQPI